MAEEKKLGEFTSAEQGASELNKTFNLGVSSGFKASDVKKEDINKPSSFAGASAGVSNTGEKLGRGQKAAQIKKDQAAPGRIQKAMGMGQTGFKFAKKAPGFQNVYDEQIEKMGKAPIVPKARTEQEIRNVAGKTISDKLKSIRETEEYKKLDNRAKGAIERNITRELSGEMGIEKAKDQDEKDKYEKELSEYNAKNPYNVDKRLGSEYSGLDTKSQYDSERVKKYGEAIQYMQDHPDADPNLDPKAAEYKPIIDQERLNKEYQNVLKENAGISNEQARQIAQNRIDSEDKRIAEEKKQAEIDEQEKQQQEAVAKLNAEYRTTLEERIKKGGALGADAQERLDLLNAVEGFEKQAVEAGLKKGSVAYRNYVNKMTNDFKNMKVLSKREKELQKNAFAKAASLSIPILKAAAMIIMFGMFAA